MTTFWHLPIQHTTAHGISLRHMAYDPSVELGGLPQVEFPGEEGKGLGKASAIAAQVAGIVDGLKADGTLPPTTRVDAGSSHIVVYESRYGHDDIFAIFDVNV